MSGLSFRQNTHQLYSASFDRSVKLWSVDEMTYIETLFVKRDFACLKQFFFNADDFVIQGTVIKIKY